MNSTSSIITIGREYGSGGRQRMSDIIYMSLARWGEEYEQIRQDD